MDASSRASLTNGLCSCTYVIRLRDCVLSVFMRWRLQTRVTVRIQAIVTELVFEHALRVRMKAETSETAEVKSGENTAVATPDSASQAETEGSDSEGGDAETATSASHTATSSTATVVAPASASAKGKGKASSVTEPPKKVEAPEPPKGKGKNLVGRINNLVSSDLSSLENLSMFIVFASA